MDDNSNPGEGTGTDTSAPTDADFLAFLGESEQTNPGEQENEEQDAQTQDENSEQTDEQTAPDDQVITLPDGEQVRFGDLKEQRMLKSDYTQKRQVDSEVERKNASTTQRLTEQARLLDDHAKQFDTAFANVIEFARSQIPQQPDPNLAAINTAAYIQQKAYYDQALERFNGIVATRNQHMAELQRKADSNLKAFQALELQKLEQALPHLRGNPQKLEKFNSAALSLLKSFDVPEPDRQWNNATASVKRIVARLLFLEEREKGRATSAPNGQARNAPAPRAAPRTAAPSNNQAKAVQTFRQSGSVASAKAALDSGAFDKFFT